MSKLTDIVADGTNQPNIIISDEMRTAARELLDAYYAPNVPTEHQTATQRILREKKQVAPDELKLGLARKPTREMGVSSNGVQQDAVGAARERLLDAARAANPELDPANLTKGGQPDYPALIQAERSLAGPLNALVAQIATQERQIESPPRLFGNQLNG